MSCWLWIGFVGRSFDQVRGAAVAGLEKEDTGIVLN